YDVAFANASTGLFNIWSTESNGDYITNLASGISGNSLALEGFETIFHQDLNGDGVMGPATLIAAGATVEFASGNNSAVKFAAATGSFVLDHSTAFTGEIYGLSGNGNPTESDQLDLKDIVF